jgi:hypothetical protein
MVRKSMIVNDVDLGNGLVLRGDIVYYGARLAMRSDVAPRSDLSVSHPLYNTDVLRCTTLGVDAIVDSGKQVPVDPTTGEPISIEIGD